jgi:hypothetical protein
MKKYKVPEQPIALEAVKRLAYFVGSEDAAPARGREWATAPHRCCLTLS